MGVGRTAEGEVGSVEMMRCEARGSTRSCVFLHCELEDREENKFVSEHQRTGAFSRRTLCGLV